jgi:predicted alpha/beta superfamily hydrolase
MRMCPGPLLLLACVAGGPTTRPVLPHTVVGTLRPHTLDAPTLGGRRTVRVWLPPDYDADPARRYAVLYAFDGQNCFDRATSAFGVEWQMDETLLRLAGDRTRPLPPLLVVGIDNGPDRVGEYTYDADPRHGGGRAAATEAFVCDTVMPFVARTYRVSPDEAYVGGSSLGGLMALDLARHRSGVFRGVLAMSPSLWWNDGALLRALGEKTPFAGTRVWVDTGTAEEPGEAGRRHVERARQLDALLSRAGVAHRLMIDDGARHTEAAWAKRFPQAVCYVMTGR